MTPRRSVTSAILERPVILRGLFSRSLPLRYSATWSCMAIGEHSWKPASGPSVLPSPRSTRKLNRPHGRSRLVAMRGPSRSGEDGPDLRVVADEVAAELGEGGRPLGARV